MRRSTRWSVFNLSDGWVLCRQFLRCGRYCLKSETRTEQSCQLFLCSQSVQQTHTRRSSVEWHRPPPQTVSIHRSRSPSSFSTASRRPCSVSLFNSLHSKSMHAIYRGTLCQGEQMYKINIRVVCAPRREPWFRNRINQGSGLLARPGATSPASASPPLPPLPPPTTLLLLQHLKSTFRIISMSRRHTTITK